MNKRLFDEQQLRNVGARQDAPAIPNPFEIEAETQEEPTSAGIQIDATQPEQEVVAETVEAEPVVVVPVVVAAPSMSSREDIVPHRVGQHRESIPEGIIPRGIYNPGLKSLVDGIRKDATVPEAITFMGDSINKGKEIFPAIWEEGGASPNKGSVILVTDTNGGRKEAALVWHGDKYVNGRHALIGVNEGDIVLCGVDSLRTKDGRECDDLVVAYRVISITPRQSTDDRRCQYDINCVIIGNSTSNDAGEFQWDADSENPVFSAEHPAVQAALVQLHTEYAVEPVYIKDYSYHRLIGDDIRNSFADKQFVDSMCRFDTLEEMYQAVEQTVTPYVRTCSKTERVLVNTILDINYPDPVTNEPCLWVFVTGVIYDNGNKSSANDGRKFYGRVKVSKDEKFFYIDAPAQQMIAADVINEMKRRHDGTKYLFQAISSRRMTV